MALTPDYRAPIACGTTLFGCIMCQLLLSRILVLSLES
jgi:hypothetical protein